LFLARAGQIPRSSRTPWEDDWARGFESALKMVEQIAKINLKCRKRPWERGYIATLGEIPVFLIYISIL